MPLCIRIEQTIHKPVILCDHCSQEISDAREGNYQWQMAAAI